MEQKIKRTEPDYSKADPLRNMTPREIVRQLNDHIVGQEEAKRAIAIAVRNRWRRSMLDEQVRNEISPKNILMIGPTGVGKTELARRLAKLTQAPFVKVEATKYTEVGYYGRDVESMVRELVENAMKLVRNREMEKIRSLAEEKVEERILDILVPLSISTPEENLMENAKTSSGFSNFHVRFPKNFPEELRESFLDMFPIPPTFSERKEEETEVSENTESLKNEKLMTGDNSDEKENEKNDGVFTDKEILSSNDNSSENQTVASEKENAESNSLSDEISNQENTDQETTDQDKGSGTPVPGKKDDLSNESLREAGMRAGEQAQKRSEEIRESLRAQLRAGELEEREIKIPTRKKSSSPVMMMNIAGPDMENGLSDLLGKMLPKKTVRRTLPIREARKVMLEMEYDQLLDEEKIQTSAVELAENTGIIFLDEIDKIVASNSKHGADVSRQGVQRDLLPIVEGTTIQTRYGYVKTDHILFIAAGAFHQNRPGDLMPELQGRFPIRVELHDLTKEDFSRILREPQNALIHQYQALLETEGLKISFQPEAIETLADCAWKVNQMTQNIGARRLCTILERLLEEISFEAPERTGETIEIDAAYVQERLKDVTQDEDLSRFIL